MNAKTRITRAKSHELVFYLFYLGKAHRVARMDRSMEGNLRTEGELRAPKANFALERTTAYLILFNRNFKRY
jgi:hypothetical protein